MSSVFDQYFQEFLGEKSNEFDIFRGEFNGEPEGLHCGDNWQLEDRAVSSSALPPAPAPAAVFNTGAPALEAGMLLPEIDVSIGVHIYQPDQSRHSTPVDSLNHESPNTAPLPPCAWISCSTRTSVRTETEMTAHLESHWQDTLEQWVGPRKCNWNDCPSKATFKAPGSLREHIFNIHISPLVCTFSQCTWTKPFNKQYDLRRHIETIHAASSSHICPVDSCEANTKGFARKDKLLKHIREQHDNMRCPYNHCYATVLATEQDAHLQDVHGSFECELGACEKGPRSCFSKVGLKRHLRKHHNMTADPTRVLMNNLERTEDNTARASHITKLKTWKDCPSCSEAQTGYGSAWNSEGLQTSNGDKSRG